MTVLNPIYTRKTPFPDSPFASIEEIDAFVGHVAAVLEDAIGHEPEVSITLTYPDHAFPVMMREEFRAAREELPFETLDSLDVTVYDGEDPDFTVSILVTSKAGGRVGVQGRSVTRVDGVDVQVRKELDRLRDTRDDEARQRRSEKAEAVGRLAEGTIPGLPLAPLAAEVGRMLTLRRRPGAAAPRPPASAGWWRRSANNPWTITIVGGSIAAAIAVGLVALVVLLASSALPGGSDPEKPTGQPGVTNSR